MDPADGSLVNWYTQTSWLNDSQSTHMSRNPLYCGHILAHFFGEWKAHPVFADSPECVVHCFSGANQKFF